MPALRTFAATIALTALLAAPHAAIAQGGGAKAAPTPPSAKPVDLQQRHDAIVKNQERQAMDQAEGNYGPPPNLFPLGGYQPAFENPRPASDQMQTGVKRYDWSEDAIMSIRARHGMVSTIKFPSWERIESFYLGDQMNFAAKIASGSV